MVVEGEARKSPDHFSCIGGSISLSASRRYADTQYRNFARQLHPRWSEHSQSQRRIESHKFGFGVRFFGPTIAATHHCEYERSANDDRNDAGHHLTRHKISDRETCKAINEVNGWMAKTHEVDRALARGSLHRLVRCLTVF